MDAFQFKLTLSLSLIGISLGQFGYGGYGGYGMDPYGWGRGASGGAANPHRRQLGMFGSPYSPIGHLGYGLTPSPISDGYGYGNGFDAWGRKTAGQTSGRHGCAMEGRACTDRDYGPMPGEEYSYDDNEIGRQRGAAS